MIQKICDTWRFTCAACNSSYVYDTKDNESPADFATCRPEPTIYTLSVYLDVALVVGAHICEACAKKSLAELIELCSERPYKQPKPHADESCGLWRFDCPACGATYHFRDREAIVKRMEPDGKQWKFDCEVCHAVARYPTCRVAIDTMICDFFPDGDDDETA